MTSRIYLSSSIFGTGKKNPQLLSPVKLQKIKVSSEDDPTNSKKGATWAITKVSAPQRGDVDAQPKRECGPTRAKGSARVVVSAKHALRQQERRRRKNANAAAGSPNVELADAVAVPKGRVESTPSSVPEFSVRPKKRPRKKMSASAQLDDMRAGLVDLETADSILCQTNLRALLNQATFAKLPVLFQHRLIQLLPSADKTTLPSYSDFNYKLSFTALHNEFFAKACATWKEKLADGEFTPENMNKKKHECEKERNKLDPWKVKNFEPIWGDSSRTTEKGTSEVGQDELERTQLGQVSKREDESKRVTRSRTAAANARGGATDNKNPPTDPERRKTRHKLAKDRNEKNECADKCGGRVGRALPSLDSASLRPVEMEDAISTTFPAENLTDWKVSSSDAPCNEDVEMVECDSRMRPTLPAQSQPTDSPLIDLPSHKQHAGNEDIKDMDYPADSSHSVKSISDPTYSSAGAEPMQVEIESNSETSHSHSQRVNDQQSLLSSPSDLEKHPSSAVSPPCDQEKLLSSTISNETIPKDIALVGSSFFDRSKGKVSLENPVEGNNVSVASEEKIRKKKSEDGTAFAIAKEPLPESPVFESCNSDAAFLNEARDRSSATTEISDFSILKPSVSTTVEGNTETHSSFSIKIEEKSKDKFLFSTSKEEYSGANSSLSITEETSNLNSSILKKTEETSNAKFPFPTTNVEYVSENSSFEVRNDQNENSRTWFGTTETNVDSFLTPTAETVSKEMEAESTNSWRLLRSKEDDPASRDCDQNDKLISENARPPFEPISLSKLTCEAISASSRAEYANTSDECGLNFDDVLPGIMDNFNDMENAEMWSHELQTTSTSHPDLRPNLEDDRYPLATIGDSLQFADKKADTRTMEKDRTSFVAKDDTPRVRKGEANLTEKDITRFNEKDNARRAENSAAMDNTTPAEMDKTRWPTRVDNTSLTETDRNRLTEESNALYTEKDDKAYAETKNARLTEIYDTNLTKMDSTNLTSTDNANSTEMRDSNFATTDNTRLMEKDNARSTPKKIDGRELERRDSYDTLATAESFSSIGNTDELAIGSKGDESPMRIRKDSPANVTALIDRSPITVFPVAVPRSTKTYSRNRNATAKTESNVSPSNVCSITAAIESVILDSRCYAERLENRKIGGKAERIDLDVTETDRGTTRLSAAIPQHPMEYEQADSQNEFVREEKEFGISSPSKRDEMVQSGGRNSSNSKPESENFANQFTPRKLSTDNTETSDIVFGENGSSSEWQGGRRISITEQTDSNSILDPPLVELRSVIASSMDQVATVLAARVVPPIEQISPGKSTLQIVPDSQFELPSSRTEVMETDEPFAEESNPESTRFSQAEMDKSTGFQNRRFKPDFADSFVERIARAPSFERVDQNFTQCAVANSNVGFSSDERSVDRSEGIINRRSSSQLDDEIFRESRNDAVLHYGCSDTRNVAALRDSRPNSRNEAGLRDSRPSSRDESVLRDSRPSSRDESVLCDSRPNSRDESVLCDSRPNSRNEAVLRDSRPNSRNESVLRDNRPNSRNDAILHDGGSGTPSDTVLRNILPSPHSSDERLVGYVFVPETNILNISSDPNDGTRVVRVERSPIQTTKRSNDPATANIIAGNVEYECPAKNAAPVYFKGYERPRVAEIFGDSDETNNLVCSSARTNEGTRNESTTSWQLPNNANVIRYAGRSPSRNDSQISPLATSPRNGDVVVRNRSTPSPSFSGAAVSQNLAPSPSFIRNPPNLAPSPSFSRACASPNSAQSHSLIVDPPNLAPSSSFTGSGMPPNMVQSLSLIVIPPNLAPSLSFPGSGASPIIAQSPSLFVIPPNPTPSPSFSCASPNLTQSPSLFVIPPNPTSSPSFSSACASPNAAQSPSLIVNSPNLAPSPSFTGARASPNLAQSPSLIGNPLNLTPSPSFTGGAASPNSAQSPSLIGNPPNLGPSASVTRHPPNSVPHLSYHPNQYSGNTIRPIYVANARQVNANHLPALHLQNFTQVQNVPRVTSYVGAPLYRLPSDTSVAHRPNFNRPQFSGVDRPTGATRNREMSVPRSQMATPRNAFDQFVVPQNVCPASTHCNAQHSQYDEKMVVPSREMEPRNDVGSVAILGQSLQQINLQREPVFATAYDAGGNQRYAQPRQRHCAPMFAQLSAQYQQRFVARGDAHFRAPDGNTGCVNRASIPNDGFLPPRQMLPTNERVIANSQNIRFCAGARPQRFNASAGNNHYGLIPHRNNAPQGRMVVPANRMSGPACNARHDVAACGANNTRNNDNCAHVRTSQQAQMVVSYPPYTSVVPQNFNFSSVRPNQPFENSQHPRQVANNCCPVPNRAPSAPHCANIRQPFRPRNVASRPHTEQYHPRPEASQGVVRRENYSEAMPAVDSGKHLENQMIRRNDNSAAQFKMPPTPSALPATGLKNVGMVAHSVGEYSGQKNVGMVAHSVGEYSGQKNVGMVAHSVGEYSGQKNVGMVAHTVGEYSGQKNVGMVAHSVGEYSGQKNVGMVAHSVGEYSGQKNVGMVAHSVGEYCGQKNVSMAAHSVGEYSGQKNVGMVAHSVGEYSGQKNVGMVAHSVGEYSGQKNVGMVTHSVGEYSGQKNVGMATHPVGEYCGQNMASSFPVQSGAFSTRARAGPNLGQRMPVTFGAAPTPGRPLLPKGQSKSAGGRSGRATSNRPPPGDVNLERSYQICQAVIANSPNRDQLRCQLKPLPTSSQATPQSQFRPQVAVARPAQHHSHAPDGSQMKAVAMDGNATRLVFVHPRPVGTSTNDPNVIRAPNPRAQFQTVRPQMRGPNTPVDRMRFPAEGPRFATQPTHFPRTPADGANIRAGNARRTQQMQPVVQPVVKAECTCNLEAMVLCKDCGAFCHADCVSPDGLCEFCVDKYEII